jgi:glyoxylase-like metal-dependent hydrolase (beta-lactamase superfamily II)
MSGPLEIVSFAAGPVSTNTFLVIDRETRHALVVDVPPGAVDELWTEIGTRGLTIDAIVITHGHWDHIGDAESSAAGRAPRSSPTRRPRRSSSNRAPRPSPSRSRSSRSPSTA